MGGVRACLKALLLLTTLSACSGSDGAQQRLPHRRLAQAGRPAVRTCQELLEQLNSSPSPERVLVEGVVHCDGGAGATKARFKNSVVIKGAPGASSPAVVEFGSGMEGSILSSGVVVGFEDVVLIQNGWEVGSAGLKILSSKAGGHAGVHLYGSVLWTKKCLGVGADNFTASGGQFVDWIPQEPSEKEALGLVALALEANFSKDFRDGGRADLNLQCTLVVCDPSPTSDKLEVVRGFLRSRGEAGCPPASDPEIKLANVELIIVAVLGVMGGALLMLLFGVMWCLRARAETGKGASRPRPGTETMRDGMDYWTVQKTDRDIKPINTEIQYLDESTMHARSLDGAGLADIEVGSPLGRGGFGKVYKGIYRGIVLAVKVIDHDGTSTDGSHEPMEALLSKFVNHPNVIRTYLYQTKKRDVGRPSTRPGGAGPSGHRTQLSGGSATLSELTGDDFSNLELNLGGGPSAQERAYRTWMIMEFCDRQSLHLAMKEGLFFHDEHKRKPNHKHMILTAMDIAGAMSYLHSKRIIHGDLKGHNVLLKSWSADERGFVCKVGDFGLSRVVTSGGHLQTFTCGSIRYMPPELLRDGLLTPALDVFSFGILLWEVVSGKRAYPTRRNDEIIVSIVEGKRPAMPAHCPVGLASLIEDCWQHDHSKRPTFGRILERLQAIGTEFGHPLSQGLMRIAEEAGPTSDRGRSRRASDAAAGGRGQEIVSTGSQDAPMQSPLLGGVLRRAGLHNPFWGRRSPFRRSTPSASEAMSSETESSLDARNAARTLSLRVPPSIHAESLWQRPTPGGAAGNGPTAGPGRVTPQTLHETSPDAAGRTMVRRGKSAGMWDASKAPFAAGAMPWRSVPPNYQRNLRLSNFSNSPSPGGGLVRPLKVKHGGFGAEERRTRSAGASRKGKRAGRSRSGGGVRDSKSDLELATRGRGGMGLAAAAAAGPSSATRGAPGQRREAKASPEEENPPSSPSPSDSSWSFQSVQSYPTDDEHVSVFVASGRTASGPGDAPFSTGSGPPSHMGLDRTESKISWRSDLSTYYFTPSTTAERAAVLEAMRRAEGEGTRSREMWSSRSGSGKVGALLSETTESRFSTEFSRSDLGDSVFETPTDFVMLDAAAMAARERRGGSPTPR